jgi:allophanate hydrolase
VNLGVRYLLEEYRRGRTTPQRVIESIIERRRQFSSHAIWISQVDDVTLRARAVQLAALPPDSLPLYGIPFAIKDNIDFAGLPTTAACPAFAYSPVESAFVVQRLIDAGAIVIGKTNLDQFATGLVGTRSPYGICRNSFDPDYISGGSSSGSAVAVALGLASFALGTDTAGSGRVPAAFNNLVGYKPTLGAISTAGVVPACRSLDAVSVFTLTAEDAACVARTAVSFNALDPAARRSRQASSRGWSQRPTFRVGVPLPSQREFFGNADYARAFEQCIGRIHEMGGEVAHVDISALLETARLLYEGPWVAERYLATQLLLEGNPDALLPVTRAIVSAGAVPTARDAFRAQYRLRELQRSAEALWRSAEVLLLPTAGTHPRIAEVEADPIGVNNALGWYTNFVNLLNLAAVAAPAGFCPNGLPFGVTLIAPEWHDDDLLCAASRLQRICVTRTGATGDVFADEAPFDWSAGLATIDVAVCGAHMEGLPLNGQLTARGAWRVATGRTSPVYRLFLLQGGPPWRPGLVQVEKGGVAVELEVWRMPEENFGSFVSGIPSPLCIGKVILAEGSRVSGFVCESAAVKDQLDISEFGGWRKFLANGVPFAT